MTEVVASLAAIAIIMALGWLYWLVVNAPWGWEDDKGFHEGKKDD